MEINDIHVSRTVRRIGIKPLVMIAMISKESPTLASITTSYSVLGSFGSHTYTIVPKDGATKIVLLQQIVNECLAIVSITVLVGQHSRASFTRSPRFRSCHGSISIVISV